MVFLTVPHNPHLGIGFHSATLEFERWHNTMRYCISAFLLLMIPAYAFASDCPEISEQLSQHIEMHAKEINGSENCRFRRVLAKEDIELVLYSIEGACFNKPQPKGSCGNKYFRYLAGFKRGTILPPLKVGGKGEFSPKDIILEGDKIILNGLSYAKSDPMCCPSLKDKKILFITESGFKWAKP